MESTFWMLKLSGKILIFWKSKAIHSDSLGAQEYSYKNGLDSILESALPYNSPSAKCR
jgi:hypothetical protein